MHHKVGEAGEPGGIPERVSLLETGTDTQRKLPPEQKLKDYIFVAIVQAFFDASFHRGART